jgi:hypothetical protein
MWNNYYKFHESKKSFQSFLEYIFIFEYVLTCIFFMQIYSKPPLYKEKMINFFTIFSWVIFCHNMQKNLWKSCNVILTWFRLKNDHLEKQYNVELIISEDSSLMTEPLHRLQ